MSKIYLPTSGVHDWTKLLADPEKHWKRGYSAVAVAYSWEQANGFPSEVRAILTKSFPDIDLLLALPEHQVPLPGGSRPSQNDVWVLARSAGHLLSIAVEGKVSEPFGPTVQEWRVEASNGKTERLRFLGEQLGLLPEALDTTRYQLLHRTVSAILEAKRFGAPHAIMLVHSFSQSDAWFEDYEAFVSLLGGVAAKNDLTSVGVRSGISLHLGWVRGNARYLSIEPDAE